MKLILKKKISIGGSLTLTGNTALTDFCAIPSLVDDANQITTAAYTVSGNSYNPTYTAIQITTLPLPNKGIGVAKGKHLLRLLLLMQQLEIT